MRYNLIALLSIVCLLASCSAEGGKDMFDVPHDGYTLFEADFEAVDFDGQQSDFVWDKDLAIGVFGSEGGENEKYTLKKAFDGKAAGEFYGRVVYGDVMAYYPYEESYGLYGQGLTYSLAPAQNYTAESTLLDHFNRYAGYAYAFNDNDSRLNFRYASGLLSVEVGFADPLTVTSIELLSTDSSLAGVGRIESDMSVVLGASGSKKITVDFGDGLQSVADGKFTKYPVVMPAGEYDDVTLVLKVNGQDDIVCVLDPFSIERISAGDYKVTEIVVTTGALGDFEIEGGLEFEPQN